MSSSSSESRDCKPCRAHVVDLCKKVRTCQEDPLVEILNANIPQEEKLQLVAQLNGRCCKPCHREKHVDRFLKTISKLYDNQTSVSYACEKPTWNTFPESLLNYATLIIYLRLVGLENYSKPHTFECGQLEIGQFVFESAGEWRWTVLDRTTGKVACFYWDPEHPVVSVFETETCKLNSREVEAQGYRQVDCESTDCPCDSLPDSESTEYFKDCKGCESSDSVTGGGCYGCGDLPLPPQACVRNDCCNGFSNIDLSCISKSLLCKIEKQRHVKCKPQPLCPPCNKHESSDSSSSSADCKPCKQRETHEQRHERRTRSRHERKERKHECHDRERRSRDQCAEITIKVTACCDSSSSSSCSTDEKCYVRELASVLPSPDFVLTASSEGECNKVTLERVGNVFAVKRPGLPDILSTFPSVGIQGVQKVWNAQLMSFPLGREVRVTLKVQDLEEQAVKFTLAPECAVENEDQSEFDMEVLGNDYHFNIRVEDWRRTLLQVVNHEKPHPCRPCGHHSPSSTQYSSSESSSESVSPEAEEPNPTFVLHRCDIVPVIDLEIETESYKEVLKKLNCLLKVYPQATPLSPESWSYSSWSSSDELCKAYE